jgi:hypothetical protein
VLMNLTQATDQSRGPKKKEIKIQNFTERTISGFGATLLRSAPGN